MTCTFCGGPWHPATGCYYGPRSRSCYRCTVEAWRWVRRHTGGKGKRKGPCFYDHVAPKTPKAADP